MPIYTRNKKSALFLPNGVECAFLFCLPNFLSFASNRLALFTNKIDLDIIADEIIRVRKESAKEHNELNILVARQREAQKALDNIIKAAEAGFFTATTRDRAEELEDEI